MIEIIRDGVNKKQKKKFANKVAREGKMWRNFCFTSEK